MYLKLYRQNVYLTLGIEVMAEKQIFNEYSGEATANIESHQEVSSGLFEVISAEELKIFEVKCF